MAIFLLHNPVNATIFNLTEHLKWTVLVTENNKEWTSAH